MFFMFIKEFHIELHRLFPWLYFHESYMCYIDFECQLLSNFHVFRNIFLFYSLLERLRTSFQDYYKTTCVFLHFGRVFKLVKIIFKSYFWKPLPSKGDWMGDHALYAQIENLFNMYMNRVGGMSYTLDPHYIFNWYHNWYLFCILIFISIYVCFNFKQYQFRLICTFSYIYMWFDCAYYIFTSLSTNYVYTKLALLLNVNYF